MISPAKVKQFEKDGVIVLRNFFNLKEDIEPIQIAIYKIIGLIIEENNLPIKRKPFSPETFDSGYQEMIKINRKLGGVVYDAVKQNTAFVRLCSDKRLEELFKILRKTDLPGIAGGGYGMRINNPHEEKYRAEWHQEYPAQLRSPDGIVYWSPLLAVTEKLGPVQVAVGSHAEGVVPVYTIDPENPAKTGAYSLTLKNKKKLLAKYKIISPLTKPGDLIIMDFCTIHASGHNVSNRSLWSMQLRYFNFKHKTGIKNNWCGSFASGVDFTKIHPELVADEKK